MADPSMSDLLDAVTGLVGRRNLTQQEYQTWHGGSADGGPLGDGYYPLTDSTGFARMVPSPARVMLDAQTSAGDAIYPDAFDPLAGTGPGHDDTLAVQRMFQAQLADNRVPTLRPGRRYYLSATISADPSRNSLVGNAAILDFSGKAFSDPAAQSNLTAGKDMNAADAQYWLAGSSETQAPTFNGSMVHAPADGVNKFMERGQRLTIPTGSTVRVTIVLAYLRSHTVGPNTYRDIAVGFRKNTGGSPAASIGGGGQAGVSTWNYNNNDPSYALGVTITRDFVITDANPWLRIQSAAEVAIDSVTVTIVPNNKCLLLQTAAITDGGQLRGHNYRHWRDFKIAGRAGQSDAAFVEGVWMDTPYRSEADDGFHSRVNFYNVDVSDGIGYGVTFGNRSYLSNFFGCRIVTARACLQSLEGTHDAGENIAFFGGNIGGGQIGVYNPGNFEIHLFGTSIDFSRQWYVGGSGFVCNGCHLETNAPTVAGFPLIDVTGGHVELRGTKLQVNGSTVPVLDTPFRVARGGFLDIESETPYNLHGTTGALCSGEGRFRFVGRGGLSKEIDAITKRDAEHNLLGAAGSFEDAAINLPIFTIAGDAQEQIDRYTLGNGQLRTVVGDVTNGERLILNPSPAPNSGYEQATLLADGALPGSRISPLQAANTFVGDVTAGSNVVTNLQVAPTLAFANRFITGPGIPAGARVQSYSNSGRTLTLDRSCNATTTNASLATSGFFVMSSPWRGPTGAQASVLMRLPSTLRAGMRLSTGTPYSGAQCLELYKEDGFGNQRFLVYLAVPVEPDRAFGMEWFFKVPPIAGSTSTTDVYFNTAFMRLTGADRTGMPVMGTNRIELADLPQRAIPLATGQDWTRVSTSTQRVDAAAQHDGYVPKGMTHAVLIINLTPAPSKFRMLLDAVHANQL